MQRRILFLCLLKVKMIFKRLSPNLSVSIITINHYLFYLAIISVPPVDTTGCFGAITTFYCESDRDDVLVIAWLINSISITEQIKQTQGITINNDTNSLSIVGLPINNGIVIGCTIVTSSPPYTETMGATFTVTDIPPVENLTIEFNNDDALIKWSPPSCVPVHHLYTVSITNDTATVNDNTTELYYTISVSPCSSNYTVTVTVIDVGFTQYQSIPTSEYEEKNNTQGNIIVRIVLMYKCLW